MDFPMKIMGLSYKFSLKPIHSQMALTQKEHIGIGGYPIFRLAHLKSMSLLAEPTSAKQNTGSGWEPPCLTNWSKFYCYIIEIPSVLLIVSEQYPSQESQFSVFLKKARWKSEKEVPFNPIILPSPY